MSTQISRRGFLRMSGAAAAIGVLAACAAPTAAPQEGGDAAMASVSMVWDTFRGPGTGWNEERIETFAEMHPDVEIEFRPLTGSTQQDNYGKMYAMHAAGDLGDIIAFDPSHFHFWRAINKGIIGSLQDLAEANDLDLSQWFETFISLQHFQGDLYGLPSWGWAGFDTIVVNTLHFEEEGVELPDPTSHDVSMETIGEWARLFYKDGERFGLGVNYNEIGQVTLNRAYNAFLINEEGTESLILDDANSRDAYRWMYDLAVTDNILPTPGDLNQGAAMLEGKLTMMWGGSLSVRNFDRDIEDESVARAGQVLLPVREDGRFPSQLRGGTWNMNAGTEHPQEAFDFIQHITSFDGCFGFNLVAGQGALVRPDVLQALVEENPIHEWFIPNLENGIAAHAPANSRGREYTDACRQWMEIFMDPNQPVDFEQGLQDLHDNIQIVLDMEPA